MCRAFLLAAVLTVLLVGQTATADAQVVVFAPHPDDESLIASGIVHAAKQNGQLVKVVLATNGDCKDTTLGHARQLETVAAMGVLGLAPEDVIFLGYPDCGLRQLYYNYPTTATRFTSTAGYMQTYGFEGLGRSDYHTYIYGAPADYNKPSMLQDIRNVLRNYRPQDIYVTSAYDDHSDHHALNFFVVDAVAALVRVDPAFQPTVHDAIVHEPCELVCDPNYHWPMPSFTPDQYFTAPPYLDRTPLTWAGVESVPVPLSMLSNDETANLKYQAIARYQSQANPWLHAFVKHDEIFWNWELWANLALKATATASSAGTASGATASRINDGSVSGGTQKPDGEWVSNGELAGAWAQLAWSTQQTVTRVVLHDRPDTTHNVTAGTLTFSDGSSLPVGALPSNGSGLTVTFAPKSVTWIRFTVSSASGSSAGLAEFEVYGPVSAKLPPYDPGPNAAPSLTIGPVADPPAITDQGTAVLSAAATDPDGDQLTYTWSAIDGQFTGSGSSVTFIPPVVFSPTTFRITLVVSDGRGGRASAFVDLPVTPSGQPANIARYATATASSQNTTAGQLASKAIDGIVGGFPVDSGSEWATQNQLAGAWLQLTWGSAQPVAKVILHDRINTTDQIVAGTLRFSDGTSLAVGTLPNDGTGLTLAFVTKNVTWIRLEVTSAHGTAVGLAEIEAITPPAPGSNNPPEITSGPTATPSVLTDVETSTISVVANDPDNDTLTYVWQTSGGTLTGSGSSVRFTPPRLTATTTYRVDVQISDGRGAGVSASVNVTVSPSGSPLNLAPYATATASSENADREQVAAKVIDGVVDGFPNDATREWAAVNQLAGGWIQLTWPSVQTIFRVVLYDRINLEDQVLAGILRFSDGSSVPVGTLPNDGTPLRVTFSSRATSWVRLEVTRARGGTTGLAEMAVYATPPPGSNPPPQVSAGPTASPATLTDIQSSTISVTASDPLNEPFTYSWSASGGLLVGSGATVTFTPPRISVATTFRVTVQVTDDSGGSVTAFVDVPVSPSGAPLNLAPYATITVSTENGWREQQAIKAADGVVSGYPDDPTTEWVTTGQLAGAWIQFAWPESHSVYRVVLHDRINSDDQILAGVLRFSDGSSVTVGTLPNDGAAMVVSFAARTATWARFEVTSARGGSVGMAEFEIYATPPAGANAAPQITAGPTATPQAITDLGTASIVVYATDADGDPLSYLWQTSGGVVTGSGNSVMFTPPRLTTTTTFRVQVEVSDGSGGAISGFVDIVVTPSGTPINLALASTATASAENVGRDQTAAKAIDGFVDGYPTDPTKEWSTGGQLAGAWIQLAWSAPQSVTRIVLHDRINPDDQVLGAVLRFSDGSTLTVGSLPNDGAGLQIDFAPRSVSWVRLEITSVRGGSTGLAEFEVY